jgi:hypothetical protein
MRAALLALALLTTGSLACGRTDIATVPSDGMREREFTLADGEVVLVEMHAGDDVELRTAFLDMPDGLTFERLLDNLAHGEPWELVLDTTEEPVLIVEVRGEPRAWIWR